jgi:hypothetical protein
MHPYTAGNKELRGSLTAWRVLRACRRTEDGMLREGGCCCGFSMLALFLALPGASSPRTSLAPPPLVFWRELF